MMSLYFSDLLPVKHPCFFSALQQLLQLHNIPFELLPGTNDIWCRDYMPVQVSRDRLVQFVYKPSYLNNEWYRKIITSTDEVCKAIGVSAQKSPLRVYGGNIVKGSKKILLCDRIFDENPGYRKNELIGQLESLFQKEIIILPSHPQDPFGHADGIVRYYDENTVLVNDISSEDAAFKKKLLKALQRAGLDCIQVPVNFSLNKNKIDATGLYLNYLQLGRFILLPSYGLPEDKKVMQLFRNLFPLSKIASINAIAIARQGGVLNCISWDRSKKKINAIDQI